MKEKFPESQDTQAAEKMFGSVVPPEHSGDHEPDPGILRTPLPEGESAHVFCEGCGTHTPVTADGAKALAGRAEALTAPDWTKHFIKVRSCIWCKETFAEAEILPIP